MSDFDFDDLSIFDMFRTEAEEQVEQLQARLLALREGEANEVTLRTLMRCAHSLKGAARVVGLDAAVRLTHAMEERFVAAQNGQSLRADEVDVQLRATDVLRSLTTIAESDIPAWTEANQAVIGELAAALTSGAEAQAAESRSTEAAPAPAEPAPVEPAPVSEAAQPDAPFRRAEDRVDMNLRITAQRFDRIIAMSSDNLIQAQGLVRMQEAMQRTQKRLEKLVHLVTGRKADSVADPERTAAAMNKIIEQGKQGRTLLGTMIAELDGMIHSHEVNADRLHREVLHARLRPMGELVPNLRRLIRETASRMGKTVRFEVSGEETEVDREILEKLRAPLEHLLTNALDHGLESTEERIVAGKPAEGLVRLKARHENGRLAITLSDDGHGVDRAAVARRAVERGLVKAETAEALSEAEVLEFLFLPGFSTRSDVSELSGRGFGLDVVQGMVHDAGGSVRIETTPGKGTRFHIVLPVTRSLLRVMRVEIENELYAVPLNRISHVAEKEISVGESAVPTVESHGLRVPVIAMMDALRSTATPLRAEPAVCLFLLNDKGHEAGIALAIDRVVDELTVAVRQLDARLGRMAAIAAVTLTEANVPMLIVEPDDVLRLAMAAKEHMEHGRTARSSAGEQGSVLVVDDSATVRQMLRRTLLRARYHVATAEDGAEAWNLLQVSRFDLLVSDVDMPQMNGIELVEHVRGNARLGHMPIILLSYKGRDEDRRRGMEAGADAYVTKGEFQEASFLQVVTDLIGPAEMAADVEPTA